MNMNGFSNEDTSKEADFKERGDDLMETKKNFREEQVIDLTGLPDLEECSDDCAEDDGFILISDDDDGSVAKTECKSGENNVSDKKIIENLAERNEDDDEEQLVESDEEYEIITSQCERIILPDHFTHPILNAEGEHILTVTESEIYLPEDIFH
ncbi:Oidioi.mRNA.OKI2018_I69.PAR.g11843.t1.cds [Oikopleura dioica]|uniref:Oidioi.mRNA.OKI2018_I69.PAR.g11843.t1.cds n=1 Tax=Oikopleura dioica TaxID=34765 RepID=A0ABN7S0P5_OIKDI|nr:Oidioi.mRNA.OKI2018_I69.PAR.g11843.t1.cds [Oikopleura dioica]